MSRIHRGAAIGQAEASVYVTWTDQVPIADIEEAIKTSARRAIRAAREQLQAHQ